ncbi:hypothetical protein A3B51_03230 [Candidatus Curtissbacteria bacterium RIFCSPLOWO2_01_FULL_41_18]|uniref:LTD domain-containing protein n=1 Tax=Candidatus Curtissbacteria bacterium RIFCSPLOWO2_01_FULL_41_18 TaxID=1797727 RepID=A0A1F5HKZ0_9BACT|nr:MAG: hypothetical protein A3B51_03230 [Candidatus Curtissbacteria bacterium RIFCSPLOWO2_01_FULL_41_18]
MPKIVAYLFVLVFFLFFHPQVFAEDKVTLNEVLVKPETSQKEWVELYNSGTDSVDLSPYWIDDDESLIVDGSVQTGSADPGSDPKQLSGQILPGQFLIFEFSSYFNDDGDSVAFFNNQGIKIDSYAYDDNPGVNVTFGRKPDGTGSWLVNCNPTPNQTNDCPAPAATPSPSPTPSTSSTSSTKSPSPTPKPSPSTLKLSSPTPQNSPEVLAQKDQAVGTASPASSPTESAEGQNPSKVKIASMLVGSGLILIAFSAAFYLWYRKTINSPKEEKEKSED